jgi:hypothetical protein
VIDPDQPPLPAHRVGLRLALLGAGGGAGIALAAHLLGIIAWGSLLSPGPITIVLGVLGALWCATLVLAEELSRHVRRPARLAVLGVVGAGSFLAVALVTAWFVGAVLDRGGPAGGLASVERFGTSSSGVDLRFTVLASLSLMGPFLAIGAGRVALHAERAERLGIAAVGGLVGLAPPWFDGFFEHTPATSVALCASAAVLLPIGAALGLERGERLEARALAALTRWREERDA